jgi:hypothetical protein
MIKRKKLLISSFIFLASFAFSKESQENNYNYRFNPGYSADKNHMIGAYNAPAQIKTEDSWNLFASARFIYEQPKEGGLDLALITPVYTEPKEIQPLVMDFDYDPGFKVSLGASLKKDSWNLWGDYFYLHTRNKVKKELDQTQQTLTNYWRVGSAVNNLNYINAKWKLKIDIADLSLGRPYYVGTKLTFNPFIGTRVAFINQKMKVKYDSLVNDITSHYFTKTYSDSWGIGPRVGVNSNWFLDEGFKIFGNISASLFYQRFIVKVAEYKDADPMIFSTQAQKKQGYITPNLDFALGLGWESYLNNHKNHIDINLGYEMNVFWNQNMMKSFIEELKNQNSAKPEDLTPHGFILSFNFDF